MATIDINSIIATTTQATVAAVINALKEQGIIGDEGKPSAEPIMPKKRTKKLPDSKSATISNILSDAKSEAREKGVAGYEMTKGEATIMEYSERSYAIVGDTKELKDELKGCGAYKYGIVFGFANNTAKGWLISKKKFEAKYNNLKAFAVAIKEAYSINVTIGESLREINEAFRAEKEPKQKAAKIVPLKKPESYSGIGYTPKGTIEGEFVAHRSISNLWVSTDAKGKECYWICIGEDSNDNNVFLMLAKGSIDGHQAVRLACIAEDGLPTAISDGVVHSIHQWQLDAYKAADTDSYNWLVKNAKVA